jgi:hypothetical protein
MIDTSLRAAASSSEFGWGDADDNGVVLGLLSTAVLVVATGTFWGMTWLATGLAPVASVAALLRPAPRRDRTDRE